MEIILRDLGLRNVFQWCWYYLIICMVYKKSTKQNIKLVKYFCLLIKYFKKISFKYKTHFLIMTDLKKLQIQLQKQSLNLLNIYFVIMLKSSLGKTY